MRSHRKNKTILRKLNFSFVFILAAALIVAIAGLLIPKDLPKEEAPAAAETQTVTEQKPQQVAIPASKSLIVPYTVQAPYGNWAIHEESCEEAALLMYHKYLTGQTADIDSPTADREIRDLKSWQVVHYGKEPDLSIEKLGELASSYYSYKPETFALTVDQIKAKISTGNPVMVPVMTQVLKNPYYSPGNVYHILLIKGYDTTGVIANDGGVKQGKDWHYSWDILWSAIDAQTPKMNQGRIGLSLSK